MTHFPAFVEFGALWGEKRQLDKIASSSCIEETCYSAHGSRANGIAEAELVRWNGIYCNVRHFLS